jgi:hypothetical protein
MALRLARALRTSSSPRATAQELSVPIQKQPAAKRAVAALKSVQDVEGVRSVAVAFAQTNVSGENERKERERGRGERLAFVFFLLFFHLHLSLSRSLFALSFPYTHARWSYFTSHICLSHQISRSAFLSLSLFRISPPLLPPLTRARWQRLRPYIVAVWPRELCQCCGGSPGRAGRKGRPLALQ